MVDENERKDVLRAQKDSKHFAVLYERYYPSIRNFIRSKVSSEDISDDLTSQTFEKAIQKISTFQWKGIAFKSWLFRIARNTVYDYFRSASVRTSRSLKEGYEDTICDDVSLERDVLHDERELKLFEVIASFSAKDQYLLYYRYFESLGVDEIASLVHLSKENVATRLHRIRKLMEKLMKDARPNQEFERKKTS